MAIKHRTYRTLANAKTWDGSLLSGGESIRLIDTAGVKSYVLIPVSAETPDDLLYFAPTNNPGTKIWTLVTPQGPMSHVMASRATTQSISDSTETTVIYTTEDDDNLDEYDHTTGIFTAKYDGLYLCNATDIFVSAVWAADALTRHSVVANGVTYFGPRYNSCGGFTGQMPLSVSKTVRILATQTIQFKCRHGQGGPVNLEGDVRKDYMSIDRII